jgi:Ca-activated chloride channel homolog
MEREYSEVWYSIEWFYPATLRSFTWENAWALYFLAAVPLLFLIRWLLRLRFNQKLPVAVTAKDISSSWLNLVRLIPEIIFMIAVMLMVVALARPQSNNEKVEQWTEGIDIMIALDISQSMEIEDLQPNRLESVKKVAERFIDGRVQDRIGLVVFSGDAFSLSPLTTDYKLLKSYLREITFEMIETKGTAIGSALAVSINRMRESDSKSKVCILLSDGESNAGNIDPVTAAKLAAAHDIKIYAIIAGREGLVPYGKDFFGNPRMIESAVDETTMRQIADIGGGQFFRAEDDRALAQVWATIDKYEKAEIKETRFKNTTDFYYVYLLWGMCFLLLWLLLKSTFLNNVLQD